MGGSEIGWKDNLMGQPKRTITSETYPVLQWILRLLVGCAEAAGGTSRGGVDVDLGCVGAGGVILGTLQIGSGQRSHHRTKPELPCSVSGYYRP